MKLIKTISFSIFILLLIPQFGFAQKTYKDILETKYVAINQGIYDVIVSKDKEYFDAYNRCDMETQASFFSENIEFFHDKGGLSTSKKEILASLEKNICGKVTRTLIEGSIEVYPIYDYGAIEIAYHRFYNNQEPSAISNPSKFIMVWKKEGEEWIITKVISLH